MEQVPIFILFFYYDRKCLKVGSDTWLSGNCCDGVRAKCVV